MSCSHTPKFFLGAHNGVLIASIATGTILKINSAHVVNRSLVADFVQVVGVVLDTILIILLSVPLNIVIQLNLVDSLQLLNFPVHATEITLLRRILALHACVGPHRAVVLLQQISGHLRVLHLLAIPHLCIVIYQYIIVQFILY